MPARPEDRPPRRFVPGNADFQGPQDRNTLNSLHDFDKFRLRDAFDQLKDDPWRILFGFDPLTTKITNKLFGRDDEPLGNVFGGPSKEQLSRARDEGIDTGPREAADNIAGVLIATGSAANAGDRGLLGGGGKEIGGEVGGGTGAGISGSGGSGAKEGGGGLFKDFSAGDAFDLATNFQGLLGGGQTQDNTAQIAAQNARREALKRQSLLGRRI